MGMFHEIHVQKRSCNFLIFGQENLIFLIE